MNRMSFALTTPQFRAKTKDVTRRMRWRDLRPGAEIMGIEKGMGLKKGQKQVELGPIKIVSVRSEKLYMLIANPRYGRREVIREGFPEMTPRQFVRMFCEHNNCEPDAVVQRIEYKYL